MTTATTASPHSITFGVGKTRPQGQRVALTGDPVQALAEAISRHEGVESWWSPNIFMEGYRAGERWEAACAIALDPDFRNEQGEHAAIPEDIAARAAEALTGMEMPPNLTHGTPRGLRAIWVLDEPITDAEAFIRASRSAALALEAALAGAGLLMADGVAGLEVDPACTGDRARFLYAPRATVSGEQRHGDVRIVRAEGYPVEEISRLIPEAVDPSMNGEGATKASTEEVGGLRPGDDYNRRSDALALLCGSGAVVARRRGDTVFLRRPDAKTKNIDGTLRTFDGVPIFYPFSTSWTPFEPRRPYTPFAIYTTLRHGGDFVAAARDLAVKGYGSNVRGTHGVRAHEGPRQLFREIPPGEQFPVAALGPLLGGAAKAIHDKIQAPLALCAQGVLATTTLAAQARRNIRLPYGQSRPLSEYFLAVAESGERKSAADDLATEPIRRREAELAVIFREKIADHRARLGAWEAEWKKIAGDRKLSRSQREEKLRTLGDKPNPPPYPMLVCAEPTYEGLFRLLMEGPRAVGIFSNESGQLIGGHAMNEDNRLKTAAGLSKGWDGEPWKRVRGGDGLITLPNRRVTLNLMAQPLVSARLLADPLLKDQGLLARTLVTMPSPASGTRFWHEPAERSDAALAAYTRRLLDVLRLPEPPDNEDLPALVLAPNARKMWIAFADLIEKQIAPDGPLSGVRGLANKAAEHAARLAGVLAVIGDTDRTDIGAEHLAAGIDLVNFYLGEAVRLHAAAVTDTDLQRANRLLEWLRTKWDEPVISPVEVYQLGPAEFRDRRSADAAMKILADHGWLVRLEGVHAVKGMRRREVSRVIRDVTQ